MCRAVGGFAGELKRHRRCVALFPICSEYSFASLDATMVQASPHTRQVVMDYLQKHDVTAKMQQALQRVIACEQLPENPIGAIAEALLAIDVMTDPEQENAAIKLQAIQRGHLARREREEQAAAATKLQSIQRGRKSRSSRAPPAKEEEEALQAIIDADPEQEAAATKLQALQRGNEARKKRKDQGDAAAMTKEEKEEAQEAAVLQARIDAIADREQEMAAAKLQAVQRGNNARKELRAAS